MMYFDINHSKYFIINRLPMSKSLVDVLTNRFYLNVFDGDSPITNSVGTNLYLKRLSGPDIIDLDNKLGGTQIYSNYSRWQYMKELVEYSISANCLPELLTELFWGIDLDRAHLSHDRETKMYAIKSMIEAINMNLEDQGFELVINDKCVTVRDTTGIIIPLKQSNILNSDKIRNTIERCVSDLDNKRFSDSVMRSRTLLEEVLVNGLKQKGITIDNKNDLVGMFQLFLKEYHVNLTSCDEDNRTISLISSLRDIIIQIGYYRNKHSSAHQHDYDLEPHVVRLGVNSTMTLIQFMSDIIEKDSFI